MERPNARAVAVRDAADRPDEAQPEDHQRRHARSGSAVRDDESDEQVDDHQPGGRARRVCRLVNPVARQWNDRAADSLGHRVG